MPVESASTRLEEGLTRTRGDDKPIAALARRQHGVVGRRQLLAMGFSEEAIDGRLRTGRLHRLHLGVYAFGNPVVSRQGRWMAAVLAAGPEAVLSHWSAAALWMIRPNSRSRIDVSAPHRSRSSKAIYRHVSEVPPDERMVEEGIPATSVPRTIFDLAATEDVDTVVAMLREAEYRNLWDRLSLWDLLERYPGRRGSRKVRVALERLKEEPAGRKRSPLEERFSPFLRRHRLPLPRCNDWIEAGGKRYQVDCHWPGTNQIVELDGWNGHKSRVAFREDKARDRRLTAAGYSVTHITWNQLDDEAQAIAADLRALLLNNQAA
ncbi:MAG TPA: type IV toxin-antitoxin system AbiEi family antitoxin domain-containing protein [Solirubrobacterales bacterium]|nr:type IV toxin-antitoxin system AbiEi family antitoxin domain-containing protein [Solirubrobacterales bacterium]